MSCNIQSLVTSLLFPVIGLLLVTGCEEHAVNKRVASRVEHFVTNELTNYDFDGYWKEDFKDSQSALLPSGGIIWKRWKSCKDSELYGQRNNLGIFVVTYYWKVSFIESRVTAVPAEEGKVAWDHEVAFEVSEKKTPLDAKMVKDAETLWRDLEKPTTVTDANIRELEKLLFDKLLESGRYHQQQISRYDLLKISFTSPDTEPKRLK